MIDARAAIRRATAADAGAVAALWWRARLAAVPTIPAPVHDETEVHRWFADVVVPQGTTWVVEASDADGAAREDQDGLVGLLVLAPGWLEQLYVDPAATGHGVGGRLLALAKVEQPDGLDLWTFAANEGARRFYERHGFVAVDATDGDNEEGAPDVRYRWTGSGAATAGGSSDG